jgi:hypothetical protein
MTFPKVTLLPSTLSKGKKQIVFLILSPHSDHSSIELKALINLYPKSIHPSNNENLMITNNKNVFAIYNYQSFKIISDKSVCIKGILYIWILFNPEFLILTFNLNSFIFLGLKSKYLKLMIVSESKKKIIAEAL